MECHLCGKTKNLEKCPHCKKLTCQECMVQADVGKVCKKCDREGSRQIKWNGFELEIEKEE